MEPAPLAVPTTLLNPDPGPGGNEQPGLDVARPDDNGKPCPGCGSTGARNLVVCIDGTSNQFSTKNTNVVELYSRLVKDDRQLTFYNSGIGTYAKPSWKSWSYRKQVVANKLDLAFALRFEKIIISAYAWLVDNYQAGDRIFFFGFSRGAYQLRALAAMIDTVGLLHKGNDDQIPFAYELYAAAGESNKYRDAEATPNVWRDVRPLYERISRAWKTRASKGGADSLPTFPWPTEPANMSKPRHSADNIKMQEQFKKTFSRAGVRVHFVGAWDTVSSVGFIRDKTLPSTTDGMNSVCFFRHALALHEFRVKFLPEYVNGGAGPSRDSTLSDGGEPHTKEVWFTGSHSDIGGGSTSNTSLDKFGPALRWMSWEAILAGLRLVETPDSWEPIGVSKSMTPIWRLFECLPIKRLTYPDYELLEDGPVDLHFTWFPHFSARRQIQRFQRIHQSVYEECAQFREMENVCQEADAYLVLRPHDEVLRHGRILNAQRVSSLLQVTSSVDGILSLARLDITRYIYDVARHCRDKPEDRTKLLDDLLSLHVAYVKGRFECVKGINLQYASEVTKTTSPGTFPFHMCGHTGLANSVAFLSGTRVVSCSWDKTVRTWDVSTGEMTLSSPLCTHSRDINCVAVCAVERLVASASDDSTICLWTSDGHGSLRAGKVLQDESRKPFLSVSFSPDGSRLASGSEDGTIRMWDTITGQQTGHPVREHSDWVRAIAFSSDGTRVVSGSHDRTVRVWSQATGEASLEALGGPLNGHTDSILSVAVSLSECQIPWQPRASHRPLSPIVGSGVLSVCL